MPDPKADDDRMPKGSQPPFGPIPWETPPGGWPTRGERDDDLYEVIGSAVGGYPRGTILRRDQLLPDSGSIVRLLELGVIRPVSFPYPEED